MALLQLEGSYENQKRRGKPPRGKESILTLTSPRKYPRKYGKQTMPAPAEFVDFGDITSELFVESLCS